MRILPGIGFAVLLLAATWLLRAPGLGKPIWNVDEAVTFTMAEQIRRGEVPYRDAVDQRSPLAPFAQAAVFAAAGDWNLHAQHAVLALMIGGTAVLLYQLGRRLGDEAAGVDGSLWFTLLSLTLPSVRDTMPAHVAWYLIFFSTAGFSGLALAWAGGRGRWAVLGGAAFGLSVLAKQPGALDFGVALVLLALGFVGEPQRRKLLAQLAAGLVAGFALPLLLTAVYFAIRGAWADLVYYTWTYNNTLYVPDVPPLQRWLTIRVPFQLAWQAHPLVVVFAVLGAIGLLSRAASRLWRRDGRLDLAGWLILGWCAAGLVATTLSGREFTHYSIQLIPGLSLACGWTTATAGRKILGWSFLGRWRAAVAGLAALLLAGVLARTVPARVRALDLPEPGVDTIAQLVRRHTAAADRIFVWGYNPEIYVQSERLPATRFLYCTFLTGMIPWTNLDPLKNTEYAVVPGAWDGFLSDWRQHPPVLVADGRTQRGFMKYPLERQTRIWPLIERDYAEIEPEATASLGYWLFRRTVPASSQPMPAGLTPGSAVQLKVLQGSPGQTARVSVHAPAGTRRLEFYLDGRLYRRLPCPADTACSAVFFVPSNDRKSPDQRVAALAVSDQGRLASVELRLETAPVTRATGGPPLDFEGRKLAALESSTITGGPILRKKDAPDHWDAHAPSRLVYPWLPGMKSIAFAYGIEELALAQPEPHPTDGVEVVVQVEDHAGNMTPVFRYYFDRELARRASGHRVDYTPLPALPPGGEGRLILQITPGPRFDPAFDWSYWLWLRADSSPLVLMAGERTIQPQRTLTNGSVRQAEFNGRFITVTGAPSETAFPVTPDLGELRGSFGLLDSSWLGDEPTGPVEFELTLVRPDGTLTRLLYRRLDPARVAADRGVLPFTVSLPQPLSGLLRLSTRCDSSPARAQAFWGGLSATTIDTSLHLADGNIPASERSRSDFGFAETIENARSCLFAHANSSLVFPWREGLGRVSAQFGLLSAAYSGGKSTEGVVFIVEAEDRDGVHRELFRRHLDPSRQAADQGIQSLQVDIPPLPGGRVILRTSAPPSGHLNNAWSYWSALRGEAGP